MRATATSSYNQIVGGDGLEGTVSLVAESNGGTAVRTPNEDAPAGSAPIGHARALFIYLKHRGVLNVEEFRRTNARGL